MENEMARGLHSHRLKREPEEKRFADAWDDEDVLKHLLGDGVDALHDIGPRDEVVAATVIQWLGSEVGQSFLHGLGYERTSNV